MAEFRQAGEEELPRLKALWEKTFGDPEEVVENGTKCPTFTHSPPIRPSGGEEWGKTC